jgi:5-amino-6-(5-phosphoribosylamino)uracil reductase/2,5-diamino-6-(ribosylamino)-4(3H)-pyrimidinone 5'-phosphate reductase
VNRRDRPKVIANFAMTADGKVTTRNRTPATFTSPRDKQRLLEIRALADAVIVGRATVATDTMSMTLPDRALQSARSAKGLAAQPLRVIVSGRANPDPRWKVFRTPGARRIVFHIAPISTAARKKLEPLCALHQFEKIDDALAILRKDYNVRTLLCEGGPTLFRTFVEAETLDELYLTVAPVIFGGKDAPTLTGTSPDFLPSIARFRLESMRVIGGECYLRYRASRK